MTRNDIIAAINDMFDENAELKTKNKYLEKICDEHQKTKSECYLYIDIISGDGFALPNFIHGTMYKNMEFDRKYTLKELGLD